MGSFMGIAAQTLVLEQLVLGQLVLEQVVLEQMEQLVLEHLVLKHLVLEQLVLGDIPYDGDLESVPWVDVPSSFQDRESAPWEDVCHAGKMSHPICGIRRAVVGSIVVATDAKHDSAGAYALFHKK
ncbi:unnamed protein product [Calypogeia fissa]